ncbi:porin family protein [Xanthovirga aplysinae]|uniref:porin family protein n=1 Tax=Xanthovirga aplysinae TaxID=2529853 RepID=UPI0012BCF0BD|nr:porin family protein [Xanthovirga aplysinae]MTI30251.1 PorT family protein [Xanthovirga aplysinae]
MKKLILSIIILIIFSVSSSFAQSPAKVSMGLRAGANITKLQGKQIGGMQDYTTGFDFAIPIEVSFSQNFALQPELHYISKGTAASLNEVLKIRAFQNYLELPILLKGKIGNEKLSGYAIAGPSFGYATNVYSIVTIDGEKERELGDFDKDADNRFDFGVSFGIGAELQAGEGKVVFDVRYGADFNDNAQFRYEEPKGWSGFYNSGIAITAGYMIPIGK